MLASVDQNFFNPNLAAKLIPANVRVVSTLRSMQVIIKRESHLLSKDPVEQASQRIEKARVAIEERKIEIT